MRAALLPSPIDPFIDLLWLKTFPRWQTEVDKLFVYLNGDTEKPVVDFIIRKFSDNPQIIVKYVHGMKQHGSTLAELTQEVSDFDHIMFIEDDGFILKKGIVNDMFNLIETNQYDMIGSPRTSSSMDLQKIVANKFNVDLSGHGDVGVAFWPNFFFCKRSDLLRTDMNFNAMQWKKGEYIKELDWTVAPDEGDDIRADTFVWGSIQLRALGLRALEVPQYHCHPFWEGEWNARANVFSEDCKWMHAGSLSGSIYGVLTDDYGNPLSMRELNLPHKDAGWTLPEYVKSEAEAKEFQRRCAFYLMAYEMFKDEVEEIRDFADAYKRAIDRIITQYKLDVFDIQRQKDTYRTLMAIQ